jgi:hypothetical protein
VNLWHPADGAHGHDFGAHGTFDDRSVRRNAQLWASQHHGVLAGLGGMLAVTGLALWGRFR